MASAILHLGRYPGARPGPPELLDQVKAEVERGGDAAGGDHAALVDHAPIRHDLTAEGPQEIEGGVMCRRAQGGEVARLAQEERAGADAGERPLLAPAPEVL